MSSCFEVCIAVREYCEIAALKLLVNHAQKTGPPIHWRVLSFPVNTDFAFLPVARACAQYPNIEVCQLEAGAELDSVPLIGFKTDMKHETDRFVKFAIPVHDVLACRFVEPQEPVYDVVVGNIKLEVPTSQSQRAILERLSSLPYQKILLVPRHPLEPHDLDRLALPPGLLLRNTMGELEMLYASARVTVMGRVFSKDGLRPDDDHNPLEATIASHAVCGITSKIPNAYCWLYDFSGLVHQSDSFDAVFDAVAQYHHDPDLQSKLTRRKEWIERSSRRLQLILSDVLNVSH